MISKECFVYFQPLFQAYNDTGSPVAFYLLQIWQHALWQKLLADYPEYRMSFWVERSDKADFERDEIIRFALTSRSRLRVMNLTLQILATDWNRGWSLVLGSKVTRF